jgi:uncharacterized integral membrane protein
MEYFKYTNKNPFFIDSNIAVVDYKNTLVYLSSFVIVALVVAVAAAFHLVEAMVYCHYRYIDLNKRMDLKIMMVVDKY